MIGAADMGVLAVERDAVRVGSVVWCGFLRGFGTVQEVGVPHVGKQEVLTPVIYNGGARGLVRAVTRMRGNGNVQYYYSDVRPRDGELYGMLRNSSGIPEIVMVHKDYYMIGLNDESGDMRLYIRRGHAPFQERIERLPL